MTLYYPGRYFKFDELREMGGRLEGRARSIKNQRSRPLLSRNYFGVSHYYQDDLESDPEVPRGNYANRLKTLFERENRDLRGQDDYLSNNIDRPAWRDELQEVLRLYCFPPKNGDRVLNLHAFIAERISNEIIPNFQAMNRYVTSMNREPNSNPEQAIFRVENPHYKIEYKNGDALNIAVPTSVNGIEEALARFFASVSFMRLWKMFQCALLHFRPNRPASTVSYRVKVGLGEEAARVFSFYTRLSRSPDIMLAGSFAAAADLVIYIFSSYKEIYGRITDEEDLNIDSIINSLEFSITPKQDWSTGEIRGAKESTLNTILRGYQHSSNWGLRENFKLLKSFLKENDLCIISPRTSKRCLATALVIARDAPLFNEYPYSKKGSDKSKMINNRITHIANSCCKSLNPKVFFESITGKTFHQYKINIYDFSGEIIWKWDPEEKEKERPRGRKRRPKRLKNYNKELNFLLGRGHCFVLVDRNSQEEHEMLEKRRKLGSEKPIKRPVLRAQNYMLGTYDLETTAKKCTPYAIGYKIKQKGFDVFQNKAYNYKEFILDPLEKYTAVEKFLLSLRDLIFLYNDKKSTPPMINLFAHNGGTFDLHFILNALVSLKEKDNDFMFSISDCLEVNGSVIRLKIKLRKRYEIDGKKKKTRPILIVFRDSLTLLRGSFKSLAETFKVKHQKGDLPHNKITEENYFDYVLTGELSKYLEADVVGLLEVLVQFRSIFSKNFGQKYDVLSCYTSSGASRKLFFEDHYEDESLFYLKEKMNEKIKKAYYGGRTECFFQGSPLYEKIYYYDVTSEYPFTMLDEMPCGVPYEVSPLEIKNIDLKKSQCLCLIKFKGRNEHGYNVLPIRTPSGMIFPDITETQTGYYWSDEVALAQSVIGYKIEIVKLWKFSTNTHFRKCVKKLFDLKLKARANGQKALELTAKILINSLYGFWAIRKNNVSKLVIETPGMYESDPIRKYIEADQIIESRNKGDIFYSRIKENLDVNYYYPAISVATAAKSRVYLWNLMNDIYIAGGTILYTDTDSVITDLCIENNQSIKDKWMGDTNGVEIGSLKNEFGVNGYAEKWIGIAPKVYCFDNVHYNGEEEAKKNNPKFKGWYRRKGWKKEIDHEKKLVSFFAEQGDEHLEYSDLELMNKEYRLVMETWKFSGKIKAYLVEGKITKPRITISFKKDYKKGVVREDGWIFPLLFNK